MKRDPVIWFSLPVVLLLGALLYAGAMALWSPVRKIAQGGITAAFAHDLAEYTAKHEENLPANWDTFVRWMKAEKHSDRWQAAELQSRFAIQISHVQRTEGVPVYVRVIDARLANMEGFVNWQVHSARAESD